MNDKENAAPRQTGRFAKLCACWQLWLAAGAVILLAVGLIAYPPLWNNHKPDTNEAAFFEGASDVVNINTATEQELMLLPGVGEKTAAAIIDWRQENGEFASAEDLLQVPGIGPKTIEKLLDLVEI